MKKIMLLIFLLVSIPLYADVLDEYVNKGIKANLGLKEKVLALKISQAELDEAGGKLWPTVDFESNYFKAIGGGNLNVNLSGFVEDFYESNKDKIENPFDEIEIKKRAELDMPYGIEQQMMAKLCIKQPLFYPQVLHNKSYYSQLAKCSANEKNAWLNNLIFEIKSTYYNYLKATVALNLCKDNLDAIKEKKRLYKVLLENEKITPEKIIQVEIEAQEMIVKIDQIALQQKKARFYFNFLLNQDMDTPIICLKKLLLISPDEINISKLKNDVKIYRYDLHKIENAIGAAKAKEKMAACEFLPKVAAVANLEIQKYGFQNISRDDAYAAAGIAVQFNLFNGFQDKAKIKQANLTVKQLENQYQQLHQSINLKLENALGELETLDLKIKLAAIKVSSAKGNIERIKKEMDNGQANKIAYLKAKTALKEAFVRENTAKLDYCLKLAEIDFLAGTKKEEKNA
ncbi:TolC family protein [Candidatus Margulisiibacteriota bacterium]